ncbi:MAG TPA: prolipoprotein diacylglyceryl transferase family protein [Mucilaginibacter sp.]|nr:prolipoprotein diacylglyceryl transferase family protein [Mucilaginibacter sp.]
MFPTLNDLLYYLFNIRLPVVIQTLGFFVALAFIASYHVFRSEFKRYEATGKVSASIKTVLVGRTAFIAGMVINSLLGFIFGYKAAGAFFQYQAFQADPRHYIFSLQGSPWAGIVVALIFALWVYRDQKGDLKIKTSKPVEKTIHPYQLMGTIVVSVGIAGVIGSKLFDIIEHLDVFKYDPIRALFKTTGYNYYGGLIFGALTYLYIGHRHGMKLVHLADIGSPGMMLAYGVGRIGCQLAGDGDWGIINLHPKPGFLTRLPNWMWSFRYPHNAINAGIPIPWCDGNYCNQLVNGVYPTPFYEAVLCIGLFLMMWFFRRKIVTPGKMFCLYLVLNGGERLMIECIRINPRYPILGMNMTQAQMIAILMLLGGLAGFAYMAFVRRRVRKSNPVS